MAAVVGEPEVVDLVVGRGGADGLEPPEARGPPTRHVEHEVRPQLGAVVGVHAGHVGDPAGTCFGEQPGHGHATPHVEPRGHDRVGDRRLDDGPAAGEGHELVVALALPPGHLLGDRLDHVERQRPGVPHGLGHVGQVLVELLAELGLEVVGEPELVDAAALPAFPRVTGVGRRRRGVALEHGHLVTVTLQQQSGAHPDQATADDHHSRHRALLSPARQLGHPGAERSHRDAQGGLVNRLVHDYAGLRIVAG